MMSNRLKDKITSVLQDFIGFTKFVSILFYALCSILFLSVLHTTQLVGTNTQRNFLFFNATLVNIFRTLKQN